MKRESLDALWNLYRGEYRDWIASMAEDRKMSSAVEDVRRVIAGIEGESKVVDMEHEVQHNMLDHGVIPTLLNPMTLRAGTKEVLKLSGRTWGVRGDVKVQEQTGRTERFNNLSDAADRFTEIAADYLGGRKR